MRIQVGGDFFETQVELDAVTRRWVWRGYSCGAVINGSCETESKAEKEAKDWLRERVSERAGQWRALTSVVRP